MKNNYYHFTSLGTYWSGVKIRIMLPVLFLLITFINLTSSGQGVNIYSNKITSEDIISSIRGGNFDDFDPLAANVLKERNQFINVLLNIFKDARASDYQKCAAAYFLGEMRASEAVDDLAVNITLHLDYNAYPVYHARAFWPSISSALVKIGTPAIPALIKNLQESDDTKSIELSLTVLYRIEGDKDIVQLRLQKALNAQPDATKKIRLLAALKSLPEIKIIQLGVVN